MARQTSYPRIEDSDPEGRERLEQTLVLQPRRFVVSVLDIWTDAGLFCVDLKFQLYGYGVFKFSVWHLPIESVAAFYYPDSEFAKKRIVEVLSIELKKEK